MSSARKPLHATTLGVVVAGMIVSLGGCNTGGGMPQMLESTKPRMDGEQEVGPPGVKAETRTETTPTPDQTNNPRHESPAPVR
jgi:hypothetical protein